MSFTRGLAGLYWRMSRWTPSLEPAPDRGVILGVPHTSNWDFVLMLATGWRMGLSFKWLGKASLFKKPFGPAMRALGGIAVDRSGAHGLVAELVRRADEGEKFLLVITPEGTRGRREYWKSGFYRIATGANLPLVLGFVDRRIMTAGIGPTIDLTGNVTDDMDRIRAFYAGKVGVRDKPVAPPRLREEDEAAD